MAKVKLTKETILGGHTYPAGSVVEVEDDQAKAIVGSGAAKDAPAEAAVTPPPGSEPEEQANA